MPLQTQGKRRAIAQDVPVKRFRVSRACDQCRAERSKCDGNQPQCAPCFDNDRACTYTSNPKKRGLPPGYIRGIELALALICKQSPEIEASLIAKLGQENSILLATVTKDSNRLHKSWRKSKVFKELNRRLTGEQNDAETEGPLSSGEDSDVDEGRDSRTASGVPEIFEQTQIQQPELHQTIPIGTGGQYTIEDETLTALPSDYWQLLESYSTYTQCWLPFSEKLDILKLSYSYPSHGLHLSPTMPNSGDHAELWSICCLETDRILPISSKESEQMYKTTQSLIPSELGNFQLGHAKALLNLALVNLRSSMYNAAWILVGAASRIISTIEQSAKQPGSRYVHVVASCYVLDNLLALSLNRRPYFQKADVECAGRVEEDGLEEWQPWSGELDTATTHKSRLPILSLSSFNCLVYLIDVLVTGHNTGTYRHGIQQLSVWKAALSSKFDYIKMSSMSIPLTPPAMLLQLTHFVTILTCEPCHLHLERCLELLEFFQTHLGPRKLPCIVICLLHCIEQSSESFPLDEEMKLRIKKIINDFATVGCRNTEGHSATTTQEDSTHTINRSYRTTSYARPTQGTFQTFQERGDQVMPPQIQQRPIPNSLLEDLLPDMYTRQQLQTSSLPISTDFASPAQDAYDPSISGDLESYFDELAFLHGAKKLQNQPQFMQNLGFAPEASMADLLATQSGQAVPMVSSTFSTEHNGESLQLPLSDY